MGGQSNDNAIEHSNLDDEKAHAEQALRQICVDECDNCGAVHAVGAAQLVHRLVECRQGLLQSILQCCAIRTAVIASDVTVCGVVCMSSLEFGAEEVGGKSTCGVVADAQLRVRQHPIHNLADRRRNERRQQVAHVLGAKLQSSSTQLES